jgi:adenylosuccinate synthase
MARHASVVIGSAFGDEGKGLIVDHLAARAGSDSTVVRFNGGAQAGHTVVTPDRRRHVFSHYAAGALAGARSHLSRFFVAHPMLWEREFAELRGSRANLALSIHPDAAVTTPYDMMINRFAELARGKARHGSVGLGFGETIERRERGLATTVSSLFDTPSLRRTLQAIRHEWLPLRLHELGASAELERAENSALVEDDRILDAFLETTRHFQSRVILADAPDVSGPLIFEGAQGLLLDQELGSFPHVTRSHTGMRNVAALAADYGIDELDVVYPSRIYATRHGAGPFPGELPSRPYAGIVDQTNLPGDWQGNLRFGLPDFRMIGRVIAEDLRRACLPAAVSVGQSLAITCLDQVDGDIRLTDDGKVLSFSREASALEAIEQLSGLDISLVSRGASRSAVFSRSCGSRAPGRAVAHPSIFNAERLSFAPSMIGSVSTRRSDRTMPDVSALYLRKCGDRRCA